MSVLYRRSELGKGRVAHVRWWPYLVAVWLIAFGLLAIKPGISHATLTLSLDQADGTTDTAPNGAPLSAETQRLFQAVRNGNLGAVQQAVLDGANVLAVNADGVNAADLAESLNEFTITHFLRAYQAIEDRSTTSTTVMETEEPAPALPPALDAFPEATTNVATPLSGEGVLPESEIAETTGATTSGDTLVPTLPSETTATSLTASVDELFGEATTRTDQPLSAEQQESEAPSGDYFSRLATLNPTHEPDSRSSTLPESTDQRVENTAIQTPSETAVAVRDDTDKAAAESTGATRSSVFMAKDEENSERASSQAGEQQVAFTPRVPPRKPSADQIEDEPAIFASAQKENTVEPSLEELDVPMLAEVPDIPQPSGAEDMGDPIDPEDGSFFAQMRIFSEDPTAEAPGESSPAPLTSVIDSTGVPEYEQIRAAVIEKLRRESGERSQKLAEVRESNREEVEREEMIRQHESGTLNIQTEQRAKERIEITGTAFPPGYVPPPDGGSSGVRFLQRLGLFDNGNMNQIAHSELPEDKRLPAGMSSSDASLLSEAGESVVLPVLTPGNLAKKSMAFVDHGYSAPPAGRAIDTADDTAVAALGQIARLFQSPNIGYPTQTSALPTPGTLSQPMPMQNAVGGIVMPEAPLTGGTNAPLNSSDLVMPPPLASADQTQVPAQQPQSVPDIPLTAAELALVGGVGGAPSPEPTQPAWDVTATDTQGNVVAAPPVPSSTAAEGGGLTNRLAHIFDPASPSAVGSGGAIRDSNGQPVAITEATGSWDVVSVQAAPTAARTLLGGAVVPKTSIAVAGPRALSMGQSVVLGKGPPVGLDPNARKKACIDKRRGAILFCIERIDWPAELATAMQVDTVMYQGLNAIVRYDNGVATRFHALFPSESFDAVVAYYVQRLGNPTNVWQRTITPLAAPKKQNPTVSWKALNPHSQMTSILEIRQYDDTRGGFPDERRGAVMLYAPQSGVIFPQVSAFELMRLHPGS